jgi:hypothetical protein
MKKLIPKDLAMYKIVSLLMNILTGVRWIWLGSTHPPFNRGCRISTVIGCPGVMTILSHEVAMTGPLAEVLCPSLLARIVVKKSYCTFLWVALLHAVAAVNLQPQLSMKLVE